MIPSTSLHQQLELLLLGGIVTLVVYLLGRAIQAGWNAGRVERKPIYMTVTECQKRHDQCAIDSREQLRFREQLIQRVESAEEKINTGSQDFKELRQELFRMSENIAKLTGLYEAKLEHIEIRRGPDRRKTS